MLRLLNVIGLLIPLVSSLNTPLGIIKWQDMDNVTLRVGKWTTGRPVPQIQCDGEISRCGLRNNVTCVNKGPADASTHNFPPLDWDCRSRDTAPDHLIVVHQMSCECYDRCIDNYIVIGSCSLSYSLRRVDGKERGQEKESEMTRGMKLLLLLFLPIMCVCFLRWCRCISTETGDDASTPQTQARQRSSNVRQAVQATPIPCKGFWH